ncbi:unnamed protein product [Lupinus luteus]|uniref:Uncharacterized protein n=1 Tax=Lupinus luteus TaxID=3873 RepID=A0AAV1W233_LUPLU
MLEDIRDVIGLGGSWSEFADYIIISLKSGNLKLVLEANSNFDGVGLTRYPKYDKSNQASVHVIVRSTTDSNEVGLAEKTSSDHTNVGVGNRDFLQNLLARPDYHQILPNTSTHSTNVVLGLTCFFELAQFSEINW